MAVAHEEAPLIGLCDEAIVDGKRYPSPYLTNKIGDLPDLFPVISWQHPGCDLCSAALAHVAQVYCPLEASPFHRTLHVFACTSPDCCGKSESWKVLRSQCLDSDIKASSGAPPAYMPAKEAPMAATDWCDGADNWGMEEDPLCSSDTTQVKTQVQNVEAETETVMSIMTELDVSDRLKGLSVVGKVEKPEKSVPTFRSFYISVVEESDLILQTGLGHAHELLKEYEKREGVVVKEPDNNCEGGGDEKYEKTKARHGDAAFFRFMKKISVCPEQILRYSWNGSPVFISEPPLNMEQMVPGCSHCGSPRTFELQLMPALISLLRSRDSSSEMGVEFGTVLVYTCRNSCWTSDWTSPVDEFVFIQPDPDKQLFK